MHYAFTPPVIPTVPVAGSDQVFPVHRIYCVGKNYADHIIEMGGDPRRQPPCFFMKPADAVVTGGSVPYPGATADYHYEGELVIAIGKGGADIAEAAALEHVFGYAIGLDMTRRDLQAQAVAASQPWDTAKGFDHSAPVSPVHPWRKSGHFDSGALRLSVNGEQRQAADMADLIWTNREIIAQLSRLFELQPGDLIFTGTPKGVGAVVPGDHIDVSIERLGTLRVRVE